MDLFVIMEVLARVENKVEGEKRGKDLVMILCIENAGKRKSKTWGEPNSAVVSLNPEEKGGHWQFSFGFSRVKSRHKSA
jgi:hypothetical protein